MLFVKFTHIYKDQVAVQLVYLDFLRLDCTALVMSVGGRKDTLSWDNSLRQWCFRQSTRRRADPAGLWINQRASKGALGVERVSDFYGNKAWLCILGPGNREVWYRWWEMKHTYPVGKSGRVGRASWAGQLTLQPPSPVLITQWNDRETEYFCEKSVKSCYR